MPKVFGLSLNAAVNLKGKWTTDKHGECIMNVQSANSRLWNLYRAKSQGSSTDKVSGKVRVGGEKLGIRRD